MNFMNYRKAVFLDLDGTILDTESVYMKLMLKYNKAYGEKISKHFYLKNFIGRTKNEISNILRQKWGVEYIEDNYWAGLLKLKTDYFNKNKVRVKYGFYNLINYLKINEWCIAIVTSNSYCQVKDLLNRAKIDEKIFDFIITRDDVEKVKPAKDLYLYAKRKLGIESNFIFAVEDSDVGLRAAQDSNIKTIYVKDICKIDKAIQDKCYGFAKTLKNVIKIIKRMEIYEYNKTK